MSKLLFRTSEKDCAPAAFARMQSDFSKGYINEPNGWFSGYDWNTRPVEEQRRLVVNWRTHFVSRAPYVDYRIELESGEVEDYPYVPGTPIRAENDRA